MWTRAELKARAKMCLKRYLWAAVAVSMIYAIIGNLAGGGSSGGSSANNGNIGFNQIFNGGGNMSEISTEIFDDLDAQDIAGILERLPIANMTRVGSMALMMFAGVAIVIVVLKLALGIFVVPVVEVGKNRFYMESRAMGTSAGIGKLFSGFSTDYLSIVKTMFVRSFLLSIPVVVAIMGTGIVAVIFAFTVDSNFNPVALLMSWMMFTLVALLPAWLVETYLSYSWHLVPYILSENPNMGTRDAMRLSKEMMYGHKMNTFILGLSFFGWALLSVFTCGIGFLFLSPYIEATTAELYAVLRAPYAGRLNGFGYPDPFVASNPGGYGGSGGCGGYNGYGNGYGDQGGYGGYGNGYGDQSGYNDYNGSSSGYNDQDYNFGSGRGGYTLNGEYHPHSSGDDCDDQH